MRRREFVIGGATAVWPLTAWAQQSAKIRHIGILTAFEEGDQRVNAWLSRFRQGLLELGWTDDRKLQIEIRWAGDSTDRMRSFAKELVALKPDVIVAFGTPVTAALKRETSTIPIVFAIVSDPVGEGFVESLSRPGGNITGFQNSEDTIGGKWLELLKEIAPRIDRAAIIFNPDTSPQHGNYYKPAFEAAARSLKVEPIAAAVHNLSDLEAVITSLGRETGGGFVAMADFFLFINRASMVALATRNHVPAIYPWREVPAAGGLISYGPDLEDIVRRAVPYVDRILRGANPTELPVQVPTKFQIVVNLATAKALRLEVPHLLLARADEVIE